MIEKLFLPDSPTPAQEHVDSPGRGTFYCVHNLRQAVIPAVGFSQRSEKEMAMVWHDYGCMQIQLISMLPETTLQNCIPSQLVEVAIDGL